MSAIYFAYGSNLCSQRLRRRLGQIEVVGLGVARDYTHRFNKHGNDDTAKGNIEPAREALVRGVLYRISGAQLDVLREIESGYEDFELGIETGIDAGPAVTAVSFRATRLATDLSPTRDYLEHYVRGATEHGIPPSYLEAILPAWFWRGGPHSGIET